MIIDNDNAILEQVMKNKKPTHAGCIVFRPDKRKKRYLIVTSSTGKHWVLPKGHIEKGESMEDAALRELGEEAGLTGEIICPISQQTYIKKNEKVILQYFVVRVIGKIEPKEKRTHRWESEEKAMEMLSFEEAKQAFQEALEIMRKMS